MFEHILVPLDGSPFSECALPHAMTFAQAFHSQVSLLRVLDPKYLTAQYALWDPLDWHLEKTRAKAYLRDKATCLRETGIDVREVLLEGKSAEQIIAFTQSSRIDLIILCRFGKSGERAWPIGSVAHKIVKCAHTSVLVVQAGQSDPFATSGMRYRRLLLPLDGSQRAESVLGVARILGGACSSELLLAHGLQRPFMPRRTPHNREDIEMADRLVERNRTEAETYLTGLKHWLESEHSTEVHLFECEDVKVSLHALVKQQGADLVILSAHGYSGDAQRIYGSVAESFVTYGTTLVLIYQDLLADQLETTIAEAAAREEGRRLPIPGLPEGSSR